VEASPKRRRLAGDEAPGLLALDSAGRGPLWEDFESGEDTSGRHICPVRGCGKSYSNKDKLCRHEVHVCTNSTLSTWVKSC